ncbi:MAG: hypothetical protein SPJ13_08645 [Bacteroidales bacterium]|nr:hypothetical protein [Bacteroidales bacterium]
MQIESKTVQCAKSPQKIYEFLSDFNNFTRLIPTDKVNGWQVNGDTCTFNVGGFMSLTLEYAERTPFSRIAIAPAHNSNSPIPLKATLNLKENGPDSTNVNMVVDGGGGNPMISMMLKPKLRDAADKLMDALQYYSIGL